MLRSRPPHPALLVLGSCTSLQFGAAIAVPVIGRLGPGLTTTVRLLCAAVLLVVVHRPRVRRWGRDQWLPVVAYGLSMAGMNSFFYAAIGRIPLGIAVTVEFSGPLVLAAVLSRRARELSCVVAAAAAILALGVAGRSAGGGSVDPVGILFALVAGGFWAAYILTAKKVGTTVPGHGALPVAMLVGGLAIVPLGAPAIEGLVDRPAELVPLVAVAILSSFIPYSLEFVALRRLNARAFGVLLSLEPVVAGLAGWLLLDQAPGWLRLIPMAVVVAASVVSTLGATESEVDELASAVA